MPSLTKFYCFTEDLAEKKHNLGEDTLKVAFTNTAPALANTLISNITEITAANGYTAGGLALSVVTSAQTSGTYKLVLSDLSFVPSGGPVGPFRYAVIYNSTNGKLIGWYDYGSSLTIAAGETFLVDFDGTNGFMTLG